MAVYGAIFVFFYSFLLVYLLYAFSFRSCFLLHSVFCALLDRTLSLKDVYFIPFLSRLFSSHFLTLFFLLDGSIPSHLFKPFSKRNLNSQRYFLSSSSFQFSLSFFCSSLDPFSFRRNDTITPF